MYIHICAFKHNSSLHVSRFSRRHSSYWLTVSVNFKPQMFECFVNLNVRRKCLHKYKCTNTYICIECKKQYNTSPMLTSVYLLYHYTFTHVCKQTYRFGAMYQFVGSVSSFGRVYVDKKREKCSARLQLQPFDAKRCMWWQKRCDLANNVLYAATCMCRYTQTEQVQQIAAFKL